MCTQTCVDVLDTTLGMCEAVPYTNHPTAAVKNSAIHNQRTAVRLQLHTTQLLTHAVRRYGDQQIIPPLSPTASRSSQRPHHSDGHPTHHCAKTVAD
jgi:hypothetical protein